MMFAVWFITHQGSELFPVLHDTNQDSEVGELGCILSWFVTCLSLSVPNRMAIPGSLVNARLTYARAGKSSQIINPVQRWSNLCVEIMSNRLRFMTRMAAVSSINANVS